MQKQLFLASLLACTQPILAQNATPAAPPTLHEGRVIYERRIDLYRNLQDEQAKTMIPQYNISKAELDFSGDQSLYRNIKEDEDIRDKAGEDQNRHIMINTGTSGDQITFKDAAAGKMIQQKELGPRKYLIEDSLPVLSWHLENETKVIGDHTCRKAKATNKQGDAVIAWYTEDIPCASGPEAFGGLPGLILEVNIRDGEIMFSAKEINAKDFDKSTVRAPTEGKKISGAEYRKMIEDQYGVKPGGGKVIRIIRN